MGEILYKLLPAEFALKVLEEKRLKVSMIGELNDVYDCAPISPKRKSHPGWRREQNEINDLVASLAQVFGLICFSKDISSPLLWGHYAASGTGLALGFDPAFFSPRDVPIEVSYLPDRPTIARPSTGKWPPDVDGDLFYKLFGVKAQEWQYEKEFRYVLTLASCDLSGGKYFSPFHLRALREVIIGYRSSVKPTYVQHFLERDYKGIGVSVRAAEVHPKKYLINTGSDPANPDNDPYPPSDRHEERVVSDPSE
jgi:hypothetical protein